MKTPKQIERKIATLKKRLNGRRVYENFGEKEQRELDDFIGFIHDYDYKSKPIVTTMVNEFCEWCYTYNG